jgi:hypothetical protein
MKTKTLIVFTLLAMLLVSTIACGGGGGEQEATPTPALTPTPELTPTPTATPALTPTPTPTLTPEGDYQAYNEDSFSISYPTEWEIMPQFLLNELMSAYGVGDAEAWGVIYTDMEKIPPCASAVLVVSQEQDIEMSLDSWSWISMLGVDATDKTQVTVSGQPAYRYKVFMEGNDFRYYVFVRGTTGWLILTMSNYYDEYESNFETIVDSFRLSD